MRHRALLLLATLVLSSLVFAQPRPQTSPGVGNAVLLATNSILIDNGSTVLSGDVIVNNAASGPILGSAALDIANNVHTPAGYKLAGRSVSLGHSAVAGGDVYYNTLTNQGTIAGSLFTPLALPVFATLPPAFVRPAGSDNISVPSGGQVTLDEGSYGDLVVGSPGTVHFSGGAYSFRSISTGNGAALRFAAATDIVVTGRVNLGNANIVQPENGSGLTPAAIRIQVDGVNGSTGALTATPPAAHVGNNGQVSANLYATAGSLVLDQNFQGNGAFLGRDIHVSQNGSFTINSAFNLAPAADPQTVATNGSSPLLITLTGSDPEGSALTFSIVSGPSAGTLSTPVSASATSATVTYTPAAAGVPDSFTFRVRDTAGATGDAVVTINSVSEDPTPPDPTTVLATDSFVETTKDVPATLLLRGTAPAGVALTFSIVSSTGPFHGSLGAVTQGSEAPERSATVVYTPDAGYVGPDSFQFQACGTIASVSVCDAASFSITVLTGLVEPPPTIAHDVSVSTLAETSVDISLGETSIQGFRRLLPVPRAATLDAVEIAGNVADSNADGFGDNANALPGATPVFMSAGVNQAGGAGSNGTVRMQFEWDMAGIGSGSGLQSAVVILPTHRGTTDSLDTTFYWVATSGDGNLTNSDFESPAERISDAVMPVPPSMPIGADGTFSFNVLDQIRAAGSNGHTFFAIQGRVDESASGPARGLEVRTTASGNVSGNDVPVLALATPGVVAPLLYRITSLPLNGLLRDSTNTLITTVPYDLPTPQVNYAPNAGFLGFDSFSFNVSNGFVSSGAIGSIHVVPSTCQTNVAGCNNGR